MKTSLQTTEKTGSFTGKSRGMGTLRRSAVLALMGLLLGISNLWAENSSNGWTFSVKSDGTASLGKPVKEVWERDWSDTYGWVDYFRGYNDRTESALSIPSSVTAQTITWDGTLGRYVVNYGNSYTVTEISNSLTTEQRTALRSVSIPGTVTVIAGFAFSNCKYLPEITIPSSVTTIGGSAFASDSMLVSITVPVSVTSIGSGVFQNCIALQSATVLNSTIANNQFANCTALKEVTFSNKLTTVGRNAFDNCPGVETLTVPASVTSIETSYPSFAGLKGLKTLNFYAKTVPSYNFSGLPIETLDLKGVETISGNAFYACRKLKTALLSDSLKTIGGSAFTNDSMLVSINIPASVTSIGSSVFQNCIALQSATVLNSAISDYQFANCTALKNVTFSNNLTKVGRGAFDNCPGVETLTVPASVTSIETSYPSFAGLGGLKTLTFHAKTLPSSNFNGLPIETLDLTGVETIKGSAFNGCSILKNITLTNSLKTIEGNAFANCILLRQITLPSSITAVGSGAFGDCASLQEVTVRWITPLVLNLNSTPFTNLTTRYIRLTMPEGTEDAYRLASVWRAFLIESGQIHYYTPKLLGNNGKVAITLYGVRLTNSAKVELIQNSDTLKAGSVTEVMRGRYEAAFAFNQIPTGKYDLRVQDLGVIDTVLVDGVTVQGIVYPKVVSSIQGNLRLRVGFTSAVQLALRNTGNIDALGTVAYIAAPEEIEIVPTAKKYRELIDTTRSFNFYCSEFNRQYSIPNSRIVELMDVMDYDLIPVDSVYQKPFKGNIYQVFVPRIAAGNTLLFPVKLKSHAKIGHQMSNLISAVETPNFFNPSLPEDTVPHGIVNRLNQLVDWHIWKNLDPDVLKNMNDTAVWMKTLTIAENIVRKTLADDRDRVGYLPETPGEITATDYYDYGILRKQVATFMLVLEALSKDCSINRRPDGIVDFTGSVPEKKPENSSLRAANPNLDQGTTIVVNWGINRSNGIQNGNYQPNVIERIIDWTVGKLPLGGGASSQGMNAAAVTINWANSYANRINDPFGDNNGQGDAGNTSAESLTSNDPNDITGPTGITEQRYIPAGQAMNYLIRFENKADADLPAMFVHVYDTLDVKKYDLRTFEFGNIQIGDTVLMVPPLKTSYYREYDLRPRLNYLVGITAELDTVSGIAHWFFETLNPDTRTAVEDAEAGFLPPNINMPEGEGSVSFSVRLKDNLQHKTVVVNQADIIFDYNETIPTNRWENRLDLISPVSSVAIEQLSDSTFKVKWTGADTESGVHYHKLYAKINDGEFFPLGNYFSKEMICMATPDTLYSFYVEAVDYVGNAERKPALAEASIKLSSTGIPKVEKTQLMIYPNPVKDELRIRNYESGDGDIEIYDIYGKKMVNGKWSMVNYSMDVSALPNGMYFVKIGNRAAKFIKQ